jgi:type I restriction enzyme, S subunit
VTVGVIRNTNFAKDGSIDDSDIALLDVEAKKFDKRKLKFGDIILEKSGGGPKQPVGRVALFQKECGDYSFSNFTSAIRVNDPQELDFRFLHKFLFWKYASGVTESMQSHSTGIRNLNADAYREIAVPLPPLAEQQRIVAVLDKALTGLATATANAEKNLKNARELFESHLRSSFSARQDQVKLQSLATEITDGDHSPPPKAASGVPFITISNIVKETSEIDFSDTFFVPKEYFQSLKPNKKPQVGDILYTVTGATLGIPVLVKNQKEFCFQRHIGLIRPKPDVDSRWLSYALASPYVFAQATIGSTGAAQKTVSLSVLRNIEVPKLSLLGQRACATKLDDLADCRRRLAVTYRRKIESLVLLKQSILQKAFSGELTLPPRAVKEAAE